MAADSFSSSSSASGDPIVSLRGITKTFAGAVTAVADVSLEVAAGEFFALLGPSGCGKTTLLRILAGFEAADAGEVVIDGQAMTRVPANRRPVNMVFQSYAVFPHMSVFDNVAYGPRIAGVAESARRDAVMDILALVKLEEFAARMPDQLSGGQRQRVALARALVNRPKVLLLDEPLSALDAKLREAMQLELVRLRRSVGITFIMVTHDQNEALSMADRIAVMEDGAVRQTASPRALYEQPSCRFVADFIGSVNLLAGRVIQTADTIRVACPEVGGEFHVPAPVSGPAAAVGDAVWIALRPEKITLTTDPPDASDALGGAAAAGAAAVGAVADVSYRGSLSVITVRLETGREIKVARRDPWPDGAAPGTHTGTRANSRVWLTWPSDSAVLLTD